MEKRKCLHCNEPIPESKRADSKFCCNSCKAWYWEKHKADKNKNRPIEEIKQGKEKYNPLDKIEKGTPLEGLRGVIDNSPNEGVKQATKLTALPSVNNQQKPVSDYLSKDKVENPKYRELWSKKVELETEIEREKSILLDCNEKIKKEEQAKNPCNNKANYTRPHVAGSDMLFLQDMFMEENGDNEQEFEDKKQNRLKELRKIKQDCEEYLTKNEASLNNVMELINKIPQFLNKPLRGIGLLTSRKPSASNKIEAQSQTVTDETKINEMKETENTLPETNNINNVPTNERILSSSELLKIDYKCFDFQGRWKDFLGRPAVIFHTAVHGLPGGGKSTFCLQLSDYLAKNFGNVIYVCGEERFSKTLQEKLQRLGIKNPHLFFHDARNYDDIMQYIPADKFHFIVIDSLDTLRIDAIRLKELKEYYPQSAFVTISQSRKDGKMKGDNEILHDADTVIGVHKGMAITSKNRFNASDRQFEVFSA